MTKEVVEKTWLHEDMYLGEDGLYYSDQSQAPGDDLILPSWWNSPKVLQINYPLPDSNPISQSYQRHRMAPSGRSWTFPLAIQGGGFPYNIDILDSPPGATVTFIGRDTGRPVYRYKVEVATPSIGSYNWHFRVRDQNGDSAEVEFTANVYDVDDTDHFLHFDSAAGNNGNPGTTGLPKQTTNGWYLSDEDDSTHAEKQCFYQGSFDWPSSGIPLEDGYKVVVNGGKPKTHIGYGTGATFHGAGAFLSLQTTASAGGRGFFFANFTYDDPTVTDGMFTWNQHIKTNNNPLTGGGVFEVTFVGSATPSDESTNPSCIGCVDTVFIGTNMFVSGCVFQDINEQACIQIWNMDDVVVDGCTITGSNSGFHLKGGEIDNWCFRGINASDPDNQFLFSFLKLEWISAPVTRSNIELCWSVINSPIEVGYWQQGGVGDEFNNNYVARCNMLIGYNESSAQNGSCTIEQNVIQHDGTEPNGLLNDTGYIVTQTDNLVNTTGILDADGWMVGGPDDEHGCEFTP